MAELFSSKKSNPVQVISAAQVNHIPIVAHYARRLGLVESKRLGNCRVDSNRLGLLVSNSAAAGRGEPAPI